MKKKTMFCIGLLLILNSNLAYSQVDEKYKKSLEYLQGTGVYEEGMMVFLNDLKLTIWSHFDLFINDAKALAAIFMIIFFAIKSYEMMAGDKKLEVMPLLRPFGLVMVILWWGAFTKAVAYPAKLVTLETEEMFNSEQKNVNELRFERADYVLKVANAMYSFQAETEVAHKESDAWYDKAWDTVTSNVKEKVSSVLMPIVELKNRLSVGLQLFMTQLLELLALWLLRIAVYIVFIIQIIYSSILVILGPFAVAAFQHSGIRSLEFT